MVDVGDKVQGIVHSDADDDRPNGQHDERNIAAQHGGETHSEEPSEEDGDADEQDVLGLAERENQ